MAPELLNGSSNKVSEKVMYKRPCLIKCTIRELTRISVTPASFGIIEVCHGMGISQLLVFGSKI